MPQPIDMQTELARMTLAERVQDISGRQSLAAAQRAQEEAETTREILESQIRQTPETQSEHVDEDGRRKSPFVGRRKRGRNDREGSGQDEPETNRRDDDGAAGQRLDVSI